MPASAQSLHEPLWVENLSPLAAVLSLPSQRSADVREGLSVVFHSDVATHFVSQVSESERLYLDGETQRHSLALRWGLSSNWEVSAVLPVTKHSGGFTDGYVNRWHDFFGMSDGGRSRVREDQIRYQFESPDQQVELVDSRSGLSDIILELTHVAERQSDLQIAYAMGYKTSSGDSADWTGSDASDVYALTRFSGAHRSDLPLYWHGQVGVTAPGSSDLLGSRQKDWLWFAGLSAEWHLNDYWALIAQVDSHSAIVDSDLDALGQPAAMLSFGVRRKIGSHWAVDVSFAEDIVVESSPDIIFQASVRFRP